MWNNYNTNPMYNNYQSRPYPSGPAAAPSGSTNNIIWVQGKESAKAWQLPPNSTMILLDSEIDGQFYIKTSDNIGMSQLRVFKYTEVVDEPLQTATTSSIDLSQYVTRDQVLEMLKENRQNEQLISTAQKQPIIIKQ